VADPRQFNIRDAAGRLLCPACGLPDYAHDEAYDARGGIIGTTICPCCLWEPGFDDEPAASGAPGTIIESLRDYRTRWDGAPAWRGLSSLRPREWDGAKQLAALFAIAPHIR
jgi:hypothetical protein